MKKAFLLFIAVLSLAVGAYAKQKQGITVEFDKFTGVARVTLNLGTLTLKKAPAYLELKAVTAVDAHNPRNPVSMLFITCNSEVWLFLGGVQTHWLADGEPIDIYFQEISSSVDTPTAGGVWTNELLSAVVSQKTLEKIANAKTLEMEISLWQFAFKPEIIQRLKMFLDQVNALSSSQLSTPVSPTPPSIPSVATSTPPPAPTASKPLCVNRDGRQECIDAINANFRKEKVVGYAEMAGDVLTVHSERANAMRFHMLLANGTLKAQLRQMGFSTLVYTNDGDFKLIYDVMKDIEVKP